MSENTRDKENNTVKKGLCYSGIGSRGTPGNILDIMVEYACKLAKEGWTLWSGGSDGADSAFEKGCDMVKGKKGIFLPWPGFNSNRSTLTPPHKDAYTIAQKAWNLRADVMIPWDSLRNATKKLMARNAHQVLGPELDSISEMVVCWTPQGMGGGGTGQTIAIANMYNVTVIDMGKQDILREIKKMVKRA